MSFPKNSLVSLLNYIIAVIYILLIFCAISNFYIQKSGTNHR